MAVHCLMVPDIQVNHFLRAHYMTYLVNVSLDKLEEGFQAEMRNFHRWPEMLHLIVILGLYKNHLKALTDLTTIPANSVTYPFVEHRNHYLPN